jgi:hypothetical protein
MKRINKEEEIRKGRKRDKEKKVKEEERDVKRN